ncbi:MAG: phage minor capsid protein [Enterococcus sp.]
MNTTPHQLTTSSTYIQDIYVALEQAIFEMLAERLAKKGIDKDNVLLWQMQKLQELHLINKETVALVSGYTGIAESELTTLFNDEGMKVYDSELDTLREADIKPVVNNEVDTILKGHLDQTFLELHNTVNQTLLTTNKLPDMYQQIVKETTAKVMIGAEVPNKALAETVYKWRKQGLTVLRDKSGREWNLGTYAKTVIDNSTYRSFQKLRDTAAKDNNIDTFVMSSHTASRPACAHIQGGLVTTRRKSFTEKGERFESLYNHDYGKPSGTFGINCHHMKWIYIPVVNTNNQPQFDPEEAMENHKIEQKQRALERKVRENKQLQSIAEKLGDEEGATAYKNNVRKYQSALRKHVSDHDFLHREYDREKVHAISEGTRKKYASQETKKVSKERLREVRDDAKIKSNLNNRNNHIELDLQMFAEKDIKNQSTSSLQKAIRKYNKQISIHEEKVANPTKFVDNWDSRHPGYKVGIIKHWNKEIANFKQSIENRKEELKRREDSDE